MVTGDSSPPSITNFRGRTLAATRMPLSAVGSAPGSTCAIPRMTERSAANALMPALLRRYKAGRALGFPCALRHQRFDDLFRRCGERSNAHPNGIVDCIHDGGNGGHHRGLADALHA